MDRDCIVVVRWIRAAWLQVLGWAACRGLVFGKYRIDAASPARGVERKLRRSIRKSFRSSAKVMQN
jgi:hypothetical protein